MVRGMHYGNVIFAEKLKRIIYRRSLAFNVCKNELKVFPNAYTYGPNVKEKNNNRNETNPMHKNER